MRIAFASTPVGPLGSGVGGGVELTLEILAAGLQKLGHSIEIYAPSGSVLGGFFVNQIGGTLQTPAQDVDRGEPIAITKGSVLENIWDQIRRDQEKFDVVLNFAYDALPMRLTSLLRARVVHLVSMGSLTDAMDEIIVETSIRHRNAIAMHSRAQAQSFSGLSPDVRIVGSGVVLDNYRFNGAVDGALGFVGRVSPEKGVEDAVAIAESTGLPLKIWGLLQDAEYLQRAKSLHPRAKVSHEGFVTSEQLGRELGQCRALLVTSKWIEAFGNVVIEALACGVPVITYRRGGPAEIVVDGHTGFIVEPDNMGQMAEAVRQIGRINRSECRAYVASNFSAESFARKVENWLHEALTAG